MKINIRIRDGEDGTPTMTVYPNYERQDTPRVQHYGRMLLKALHWSDDGKEEK